MKRNGITLIETMITLSVLSAASASLMLNKIETSKEEQKIVFIKEAKKIIEAVDHRIAIDGYDISKWASRTWDSEDAIVNDLIGKELTSAYLTNCDGGGWNPSQTSERKTKLLPCNLWDKRKGSGEKIEAELREDSVGFIQGFDLFISFEEEKEFTESFKGYRTALNKLILSDSKEMAGMHDFSFVNKSSKLDISTIECIGDPTNCVIKLSMDRTGGNEYIRADGLNSMISEHMTFIESKGESPLECLRWQNNKKDLTGNWSVDTDSDCGIGIYKDTGHPVIVDVVADKGTFGSVLLDKMCTVFEVVNGEVVDNNKKAPCGILSTKEGANDIVYQVVERTIANNAIFDEAHIRLSHIDNLITPFVQADVVEVMNELKSSGIATFDSTVTFNQLTTFEGEALFNNNAIFEKEVVLNNAVIEGSKCLKRGSISASSTDGSLLNCVDQIWVKAGDSGAVGTISLWVAGTPPDDWVEMRGQSTNSYPELKALIGSTIPDMRGQFARGWDNGRGIDSGRSLGSHQSDSLDGSSLTFVGDALPGHSHSVTMHLSNGTNSSSELAYSHTPDHGRGTAYSNSVSAGTPTGRIYGGGNETRPENTALMYIIKVR